MKTCEKMRDWVLDTVQRDYPEDIALVISCGNLRIDPNEKCIDYFVPATPRGDQFAFTKIVEGVGYDVWALHWDRLERFASLEEDYVACILFDGKIEYARNSEDAARFKMLQQTLRENLSDPKKTRMKALSYYADAKELFLQMQFADLSDTRLAAGRIVDYLARSVAYVNHRLFAYSQTDQLEELAKMEKVPEGFAGLYLDILWEKDVKRQRELCRQMIVLVHDFLAPDEAAIPEEHNFQDLANWYAELSYTWLRIRHYCSLGDGVRAYMWGIYLQEELNTVCGDFGLPKMGLMEGFDAGNLPAFAAHADQLEQQMRRIITENGGVIYEYNTFEDFLHAL